MLTKKDFKKVAEILSNNLKVIENPINDKTLFECDFDLITDFISWFKSENPKFDEDKFRKAVLE